jgi:hypothetical protein
MAKIKIKKKSGVYRYDCDVMSHFFAYLLCNDFDSQNTWSIACGYSSSTVQTKLPESDLATLSVGKDGFWPERKFVYENFRIDGREYGITLLMVKKTRFQDGWFWCANQIKQIIDMKASDRVRQNNLVFLQIRQIINWNWIYNARLANIEVNDKELQSLLKVMQRRISSHSTSDGYVTRSKNQ